MRQLLNRQRSTFYEQVGTEANLFAKILRVGSKEHVHKKLKL